jgi:tetratricopeptide (TPR) repeat protein
MNELALTDPVGIFATRRNILLAVAIVAMTLLAYIPATKAGFVWDDQEYVVSNPVMTAPDGLWRIWFVHGSTPQYYPMVFTVLRLEHSLWGVRPFGYHLVNILLHAISALVLWRILAFLSVRGAWVAALIFAVHPVHVESVAWVSEIKNVLSGLFYLAAAWMALRFYLREGAGLRRWAYWAGALLLFACALLSKTVTCSLPAAILLILWWKRGRIRLKDVLTLLPFFLLGAALALNTAMVEKHQVGAAGAEWDLSFLQRCLIAGRVVCFYAAKLVWPAPLTFIYPRWQVDASASWQYFFPTAALAVLAGLWFRRGRIGRGPLTAALFFVATLTPALGFFNVYPMRFSFVADHFQYLASIGFIVLVVAAAASWHTAHGRPRLAVGATALIVLVLSVLTWRQCLIYHDSEVLWRDTVQKNPSAGIAWNNLGGFLYYESFEPASADHVPEMIAEAIQCFDRAISLGFDNAQSHNNRACAYGRLGRYDLALADLDKAVELEPILAEGYSNRGNAYVRVGKLDLALRDYDKAIQLKPNSADVIGIRAMVHAEMGHYAEALADVKRAQSLGEKLNPDFLNFLNEAAGQATAAP